MELNNDNETDFKNRLLPQVATLVAKATGGTSEPLVVETLLEACHLLEVNSKKAAPLVALEQDVQTDSGTYHLFVRRLSSSVP
ncbi:MAG: hypothetical protein ACRDEA_19500, partial [Microcystaceae cyanobacterium]